MPIPVYAYIKITISKDNIKIKKNDLFTMRQSFLVLLYQEKAINGPKIKVVYSTKNK